MSALEFSMRLARELDELREIGASMSRHADARDYRAVAGDIEAFDRKLSREVTLVTARGDAGDSTEPFDGGYP